MPGKWRIYATAIVLMFAGLACNLYDTIMCEVRGGYWDDNGECVVEDDSEWESMRSEEEFLADQAEEAGNPQPETTQHATVELSLPSECNAQQSLHVDVSQPVINDDENENRCKYTVTYTNTGDQKIWVFVHKTNKNLETEVEDIWKNYYSLDPGESLEMGYRTLIYKSSGIPGSMSSPMLPLFSPPRAARTPSVMISNPAGRSATRSSYRVIRELSRIGVNCGR